MKIDQPDRQRRSIRLPDYDYCQPGAYFITICSYQREALFGNIAVDEMRLNEAGQIVWEVWNSLPARYAGITLDAAVVMPNHFHGIIIITDGAYGKMDEENTRRPPLPLPRPGRRVPPVRSAIRKFMPALAAFRRPGWSLSVSKCVLPALIML